MSTGYFINEQTIESSSVSVKVGESQYGTYKYYELKLGIEGLDFPTELRFYSKDLKGGMAWKLGELAEMATGEKHIPPFDVDKFPDLSGMKVFSIRYVWRQNPSDPDKLQYLTYDRFGLTEDEVDTKFQKDVNGGFVKKFHPELLQLKEEADTSFDYGENSDDPVQKDASDAPW